MAYNSNPAPYGESAIVAFSGGQDSSLALLWARKVFSHVEVVTFDYGQRHSIEIKAAADICKRLGLRQDIVKLNNVLIGSSPLVNEAYDVTVGQEAINYQGTDRQFVAARNLLFTAVLINRAIAYGCEHIVVGICREDIAGFPDCQPDYWELLSRIANGSVPNGSVSSEFGSLTLHTPFITRTKGEALALMENEKDFETVLSLSHTCYKGEYPPCGQCHACQLRAQSFKELGMHDPLLVRVAREKQE